MLVNARATSSLSNVSSSYNRRATRSLSSVPRSYNKPAIILFTLIIPQSSNRNQLATTFNNFYQVSTTKTKSILVSMMWKLSIVGGAAAATSLRRDSHGMKIDSDAKMSDHNNALGEVKVISEEESDSTAFPVRVKFH